MKRMHKILTAALITALVAVGAGCSSNSSGTSEPEKTESETETAAPEETESGEGGKLIMATNAEFPPYEYREGENIVGIDVEIATAIAESMGKELSIEDINFDAIIPAVTSGKADMGVAGMTVTEDRLKNVDFSDTYCKASQVIIVRKDDETVKTPDDLNNKTIGVQLGTTGDIYAGDIEGATVERYNKGFEAILSLKQNKVDAVVIDDQVAKSLTEANEDVMVIDEPFTEEEYAIAVKKGNTELLEQINKAIEELKDSGKLDEIIGKYIKAE